MKQTNKKFMVIKGEWQLIPVLFVVFSIIDTEPYNHDCTLKKINKKTFTIDKKVEMNKF